MSFGVVVPLDERDQRQQSEHQKKASGDPEESLCLLSQPPWIGYTYLDDSGRTKPAFLNSTGAMYPKVECSLKLLYQCT